MTALIVIGCILSYLGIGIGSARLLYLYDDLPDDLIAFAVFFWWMVGLWLIGEGVTKFITMPTKRERLEQKRAKLDERIKELEQDCEIR